VRELLETIDEEADRLNELIGNLLDMSRLHSGALDLTSKEVSVEDVVLQAVASLGPRAGALELDIADDLPLIATDPALLERAVANVIDNAISWSPAGQTVRIEAARVRGAVVVRVVDRGPGIPPAQREKVFQPFQRLGDQNTDTGVGLGLAVARGFVDAVGGDLTIEDTPGGGTTMVFSFEVPA
jgi:two-component system sensor histidine kinase KdpD